MLFIFCSLASGSFLTNGYKKNAGWKDAHTLHILWNDSACCPPCSCFAITCYSDYWGWTLRETRTFRSESKNRDNVFSNTSASELGQLRKENLGSKEHKLVIFGLGAAGDSCHLLWGAVERMKQLHKTMWGQIAQLAFIVRIWLWQN